MGRNKGKKADYYYSAPIACVGYSKHIFNFYYLNTAIAINYAIYAWSPFFLMTVFTELKFNFVKQDNTYVSFIFQ